MLERPPLRRTARTRRVLIAPAAGLLLAAAMTLLMPRPSQADDRRDHERAIAAHRRGEILSMESLLAAAERALGGRVIDVDFDDDEAPPTYEFDLLLPDGRTVELKVDARDGHWLKLEGPRLETFFGAAAAPPVVSPVVSPVASPTAAPRPAPADSAPPVTPAGPTDKRLPPRPSRESSR